MLSIAELSQAVFSMWHDDPRSRRRGLSVALVLLLHMLMLYAFTHGMNIINAVVPSTPIDLVAVPAESVKPKPVEALPLPQESVAAIADEMKLATPDVVLQESNESVDADSDPGQAAVLPAGDTGPGATGQSAEVAPQPLQVLTRAQPDYPATAKRAGIQGSVVLSLTVNPSGQVTAVMVVRSSGSMELDDAAVAAARQWRFAPRAGTSVQVQLPFSFKLNTVRF